MSNLKHAFEVDTSAVKHALKLLDAEGWGRGAADKGRANVDAMANELSRLRELEVKWLRAMEREQYVKELLTLLVVPPADMHAAVSSDAVFDLSLRADNYGYLDNPVTEADLERFKMQVPR